MKYDGIEKIAFSISAFEIHWIVFGLIFAIIISAIFILQRAQQKEYKGWSLARKKDTLLFAILGSIVGFVIAFLFFKDNSLKLGPIDVHWYGLSYLVAIAIAFVLLKIQARRKEYQDWTQDRILDLVFFSVIGIVVGGRVGWVLIYGMENLSNDYLYVFKLWKGGMAFHGGLVGVALAIWLYGKKLNKNFFEMADFVVPSIPLGLGVGRLANFVNSELWGKTTDLPWGMRIPFRCNDTTFAQNFRTLCDNKGSETYTPPLHPSQLYELLFEGIVLFIIIWFFARKQKPLMAVSGLFLLLYGVFRFLIEFVRLPDGHIGYDAFGWWTRGQTATLPMIILGIVFLVFAYKRNVLEKSIGK